jgi:hypothetical protein
MADYPPKIEDAPGLIWRKYKHQWEARWQARTDLRERGYPIKSYRAWLGRLEDLSDTSIKRIQDICNALQNEMLVFGRGGVPVITEFAGTVASLITIYKSDELSGYSKLRHHSRLNYNSVMKRLEEDIGHVRLEDIKARTVHEWYGRWVAGGKTTMAHSLVRQLRTMTNFGTAFLEDDDCTRVSVILSKLRFPNGKPRTVRLVTDQINALRAEAHRQGHHSIAFANAIQGGAILRQKDAIGEWVPIDEKGVISDIISGAQKWGRGILWSEIDDTLTLHHITSKKQKWVHVPLRLSPMIMDELCRIAGVATHDELTRDMLPKSGPLIVCEKTGLPWSPFNFRIQWRKLADKVGIPKGVRNMDSRSGAISEAIQAGAGIEHTRHAATHSDIKQTQDYDRDQEASTIVVMEKRAALQNKKRT